MTGTTAKIITPQATIINAKAISTIAEMIEQSKRMSLLCSDDRTENMWVDDELVLHYTTEGEKKQTIMSRWSLSQQNCENFSVFCPKFFQNFRRVPQFGTFGSKMRIKKAPLCRGERFLTPPPDGGG